MFSQLKQPLVFAAEKELALSNFLTFFSRKKAHKPKIVFKNELQEELLFEYSQDLQKLPDGSATGDLPPSGDKEPLQSHSGGETQQPEPDGKTSCWWKITCCRWWRKNYINEYIIQIY